MPLRPGAAFLSPTHAAVPPTTPTVLAGVTSAYGRTGNVVGAEGDYTIDQMSDVDTTTTAPAVDNLLSWNGTNWTPDSTVDSGTFV